MSTADFVTGNELATARDESPPAQCPSGANLPLFRFGIRQMLWFFAGASAFFAAVVSSDGTTALVLMVMTSIVVAHISATAIGTRLRSRANAHSGFEASEYLPIAAIATAAERHEQVSAIHAQPRSPWHARGTTTLPWLRQFVLAATVIGGLAGATALTLAIGYRTSPAGIVVGGISAAVLCGWFAFLSGSFFGVFRHGFREATSTRSINISPE